ncbi:RNA recognition motif-containing protein [Giardia duodenalis]|uniref:RNA recognition motif-containing protein n=1 Tax=Giardia intestinalis (strain ATCC 50803 / WB clone C6) TaxID=184922 RepID=A8B6T1_GIAIC|nr:RNA recognition motif-containing protein [Giardia intestinalis]KAE8301868.1 RNA recognition motif-containing protein [Giardia intestinalis]|eukprot:XP_001709048.1 Hypothetical protein GL50803_8250 [Giardia lamblia ATCC 50803]
MSTVDLQLLNLKPDATEERLKEFLQQQASVTEILNVEILTPGDNKPRVGVARVIANRAALKADLTGAQLDGNPLDVVFLDEETGPNPQQKGKIDFNQVIEKVKKIYAELNSDELKPIYSEVAAMMIKNGKVDLSSQNLQSVGQKMAPVFGKLSGMFKK